MKTFFITGLCCLLLSSSLIAQDYSKLLPKNPIDSANFVEKLVSLALKKNPKLEVLQRQVNVSQYNVTLKRYSFLEDISVSGNLNEFTLFPERNPLAANFFPRYNAGIRISLDQFVTIPTQTKKAKEESRIAVATYNGEKASVRAQVLRLYQNYVSSIDLLRIQIRSLENLNPFFKKSENDFRTGELKLEEYIELQNKFYRQSLEKVMAENAMAIAKINLEELIGTKLEDVR
jgi:outer membrane protein TolC